MARRRMTSVPAVVRPDRRVEQVNERNPLDVCCQEGSENQYDSQNGHLEYLEAQPPHWAA